ncbi:hypothetical protein [Ramlibacter albus]|uniref:Uncharacterized protein n=1 Tax=Ramlibacter albus TaxID=2079448 RepID=A0A923MF39_9BURK|nr:hypothetical protein [Ramlibacter albus]MBC5768431.1 hypothetical protein [Ramlibacter albus]
MRAGSVPLTVSVVSLVMKSLALTPVSSVMPVIASCGAGAGGGAGGGGGGAADSMMTSRLADCVPWLPAVSTSLAV